MEGGPRYGIDADVRGCRGEQRPQPEDKRDLCMATLARELRDHLAPIEDCVETLLALHMEVPGLADQLDIVQRHLKQMRCLIDDEEGA